VSRRVVLALAVVLALIGGGILTSRGTHPVSAARTSAEPVASPSPAVQAPAAGPEVSAVTAVPEESGKSQPATTRASEGARESRNAARQPSAVESVDGVNDIDPHKAFGSKSAPVVMEVFSDYQCPSCKMLFLTTNRQLMDNYVSTGKVFLIHRDFPLPMHAHSRVAASYARAAAEIGKIEPVEKALYENQEKWEQNGDVDGIVAAVLSSAEMTKVRALVKGGTLEPLINKDLQLGQMYRVNQTPTTVFHSKGQTYPYSGAMSYEILRQFLDQLLSQK
jgi:protein-disulfide isomerase